MREMGVRLALGADAARLMRLILGEGLRLAVIGAAIGVAASIATARLLQGVLVDAAAWDPRLLAVAAGIMLAVAAAAAFVPARRAGAIDPIIVLRDS
jgi:putative ABC transport system permease protein